MNILEYTKRRTLFLATLVLVISWIAGYIFLDYQFKNSLDEQLKSISDSTEKFFNLKIKEENRKLKYKLSVIVSSNGLSKAVAENDYEKINSIVTPFYSNIKAVNEDIKILTFRSKDGITLYRAHKPEFYGDTLNKKRKLIVDTNNMQKSFSGFEVGKLEMTYRTTQPIFYNNKYVGNVELGVSPKLFIRDLNSIFKIDMGIAIDKSLLKIMIDSDSVFIDDNYILIRGSENLKNYFKKDLKLSDFSVRMDIVLQNHISDTLGLLVIGFDISSIVQRDKNFMYKLLFIGIFVAFMLVIILHKGFNLILKQYTQQFFIDYITGLKNRKALDDKLLSGKNNVLILSNIKEFSLLNELYGVDVGNKVLKQVADKFKSFAKEHSLIAYRISSDEYVLLKYDTNFETDSYNEILEELHSTINSLKIYLENIDETLSVEIYSGIAYNKSHSLQEAQMALKKAKEKSLPFLAYSENVDTKKDSKHILEMKRTIKDALEHNNVIPFFQPIVDRDGKIVKYEALVRIIDFKNDERKIIFPDSFLPIAIKSGLYANIAINMLSHTLTFFDARDEKISVNFLPKDFFNSSIMDRFIALVDKFEHPQNIVVEITEQEAVDDFDRLFKVVQRLRKKGVLLAIDDFGSGFANYSHILKIKPDYIKIDASLIKNILTDDESKILVKSIISFAKELKTKIIAEYVENIEIFELLKEYGVDEFQGYYFSRPIDLINTTKGEKKK